MTDLLGNELVHICAFCRTRIPKSIIDQHLLIVHGYSDPQPGRECACQRMLKSTFEDFEHGDESCRRKPQPEAGKMFIPSEQVKSDYEREQMHKALFDKPADPVEEKIKDFCTDLAACNFDGFLAAKVPARLRELVSLARSTPPRE